MTLQPPLEGLADYSLSNRSNFVQSLAKFRSEWQNSVEAESLLDVTVPVGLILSDIADHLELNQQERHLVLGSKLIQEVNCLLDEPVTTKDRA